MQADVIKTGNKKICGNASVCFVRNSSFGLIAVGVGIYASKAVYADKVIGKIKAGVVVEGKS